MKTKVKVENGIKLVEIQGSFWNRGFYPAFEHQQEAAEGVEVWFEPESKTVSFSHPGKLAIPLYNRKCVAEFVNSDEIIASRIVSVPENTNLTDEIEDSIGVLYELNHSVEEPLEWVSWADKRQFYGGEPKVVISSKENYQAVTDYNLYTLRRYYTDTRQDKREFACSHKVEIKEIYVYAKMLTFCLINLFIYNQVFNLNFDSNTRMILIAVSICSWVIYSFARSFNSTPKPFFRGLFAIINYSILMTLTVGLGYTGIILQLCLIVSLTAWYLIGLVGDRLNIGNGVYVKSIAK